jgi:hypothetical protein
MRINLLASIFFIFIFCEGYSQKVDIVFGDLKFMKGLSYFNIEYDYSELMISGKKEKEWVAENIRLKDSIKAGGGDDWYGKWIEARETNFEIKFEENLNRSLRNCGISSFDNQFFSNYTLILKTISIEPDANTGFGSKNRNAYVSFVVIFVKGNDKANMLSKIEINKCLGGISNTDFTEDCGYLITAAYGVCGKALGKFLSKFI